MRIAPHVLLAVALAGCAGTDEASPAPRGAADAPDVREVAAGYRSLRPMTDGPVFVQPALALLCVGVTEADVRKARETAGPHALTTVRIFMNDAAAKAFDARETPYPIGSVVVKEKGASLPGPDGGHEGVGGMIKRATGFDPANGDWEYFYFESAATIESGRIASCIGCHRRAAESDFVFGNWSRAR